MHQSSADPRSILLHAEGEDLAELRRVIEQLNYKVVGSPIGQGATMKFATAPMAAVVVDSADPTFDLCRDLARSLPVILVSDVTDFDFRILAARAGVKALIHRPVSPVEMSEWLTQISDGQAAENFSVLIVDDDPVAAAICAEVLRVAGVQVKSVCDPRLALQEVENETPDLVLMDVRMPEVDGVELTRVIRQSRQLSSLPIVFLSAERDETQQLAARRVGGDDFIAKPITPDKLLSLVRLRADRSKMVRALIERDRLTGLYHQMSFKERLTIELERCDRTGAELSLVMIDVDHFKQVNDAHGHLVGDHVLRTLAGVLGSGLRRSDIAGRCGGEEFGVVLFDTSPDKALSVIDRLRKKFAQFSFRSGVHSFNVTFSAGIASRFSAMDTTRLTAAADAALYRCKRGGRNVVLVAQPDDYRQYGLDTAPPEDAVVAV